jgi:SatD family (SatD)
MAREKKQYILMADIIGSRKSKFPKALLSAFDAIVDIINLRYKRGILSPLTITLGDEFQGVLSNLKIGIDIILDIEKELLNQKQRFKLRYVMVYGKIETPINRKSAHHMIGEGLTSAREILDSEKKSGVRFNFALDDVVLSQQLQLAFEVLDGIERKWNEKDITFISNFLELEDYKLMAEKYHQHRSQTFRRSKTLLIQEYLSQRKLIQLLAK